jgi:2-keto-4-pentenoate hydratase/2-oxohepta-3-ene-1,7-dioic acid hydratase in catechol pathway
MKIVLFENPRGDICPGLMSDDGIRNFADLVPPTIAPRDMVRWIIDGFEALRPTLEARLTSSTTLELRAVRLLPPIPRPGAILCCVGNYWEHAQREPRALNMWLKNPDAVIGPGDTIRLPDFTEPWMFMHEAELAVVIKGPARAVARSDWRKAVFGYTCFMDITARGAGRITWRPVAWMGKSFDTFAPLGPCIVTADEIENPNDLHVRLWNNGELRHNYNTDDMEHPVPALIEFASGVMTLRSGDVIACGTNHEGLGAVQDGERLDMEIEHIGRLSVGVIDPLKRSWERGVYMGADSTNPGAVRRHRPTA